MFRFSGMVTDLTLSADKQCIARPGEEWTSSCMIGVEFKFPTRHLQSSPRHIMSPFTNFGLRNSLDLSILQFHKMQFRTSCYRILTESFRRCAELPFLVMSEFSLPPTHQPILGMSKSQSPYQRGRPSINWAQTMRIRNWCLLRATMVL